MYYTLILHSYRILLHLLLYFLIPNWQTTENTKRTIKLKMYSTKNNNSIHILTSLKKTHKILFAPYHIPLKTLNHNNRRQQVPEYI